MEYTATPIECKGNVEGCKIIFFFLFFFILALILYTIAYKIKGMNSMCKIQWECCGDKRCEG